MAKKARPAPETPKPAPAGALKLDPQTQADILARLRRVEGQVRAIASMIEQQRDCHAVAQQMGAARSALERATVALMAASLVQCIKPDRDGGFDRHEVGRLTDTFVKILS
jgi:DNA-binding FrmR family transcriptional regulator